MTPEELADIIADYVRPLQTTIDTLLVKVASIEQGGAEARKESAEMRTAYAAFRGEFDGLTKGRDLMRGEKGEAGEGSRIASVSREGELVVFHVEHADGDLEHMVMAMPAKGDPGEPGEPGQTGPEGPRGPAGASAELGPVLQRLAMVEAETGSMREKVAAAVEASKVVQAVLPMLKGEPGEPGKQGEPGIGVAGFQIEQKDDRTHVYRVLRTDGSVLEAEQYLPIPLHVGKWIPEREYKHADEVSWHGCTWRAKKDGTIVEPGSSADWALVAKQGEKGDPGIQGKKGGIEVKR